MLIFFFISLILKFLFLILPIFITVALFTLLERKVMASMQRRRGPNVVGFLGFLQPFSDALKLIFKETIFPRLSNLGLFILAPILALFLAMIGWLVIPFQNNIVLIDLKFSVLVVFIVSSFMVYSVIIGGWASNSRYAFLGALRASAQMISYEVSLSMIVMSVISCTGSFNFSRIVFVQQDVFLVWPLLPLMIMFFISILAETNRPPFDLPEAESELVAGYFVEYSGVGFAMYFIAETLSIIFMSFLISILFFGGWISCLAFFNDYTFWLALKVIFFCFLFIWVRASLPRYRYDQFMYLCWKIFLPLALSFLFLVNSILYYLDGFIILNNNLI